MFARFSVVNENYSGQYKRESVMPVTAKQRRVFEFIRRVIDSNQEPPTIAEIGRQFEMRSSASVHAVLTALEREGLIKRTPNVSRGIQIVEQGEEDNEVPRSEEHTSELQSQSNLVCRLLLEKKKTRQRNKVTVVQQVRIAGNRRHASICTVVLCTLDASRVLLARSRSNQPSCQRRP